MRGISVRHVADLVLVEHARRRHNPGSADWLLIGRGIGVAYNWPDRDDRTRARIVTVWRE